MFKLKIAEKYTYKYEGVFVKTLGREATFFRIDGFVKGNKNKLRYTSLGSSLMSKVEHGEFEVTQFEKFVTSGHYEFEVDEHKVPYKLRETKPKE